MTSKASPFYSQPVECPVFPLITGAGCVCSFARASSGDPCDGCQIGRARADKAGSDVIQRLVDAQARLPTPEQAEAFVTSWTARPLRKRVAIARGAGLLPAGWQSMPGYVWQQKALQAARERGLIEHLMTFL